MQLALHDLVWVPSSHCSVPLTTASPQKGPYVQSELQPLYPPLLFAVPRSQSSPTVTTPSPHRGTQSVCVGLLPGTQVDGEPVQIYPHSTLHFVHPLPLAVLPSLHPSLPVKIPSPRCKYRCRNIRIAQYPARRCWSRPHRSWTRHTHCSTRLQIPPQSTEKNFETLQSS